MPGTSDDLGARRSLVPSAARGSLWLMAGWTSVGTALVGTVASVFAVAITWLPVSGTSGNAASAIRAGVLTFLAALHGGITVDGMPSQFVPLGMTVIVGAIAWRAGRGLAGVAADVAHDELAVLVRVGVMQVVAFAATCGVAAWAATLGTSHVSITAAVLGGLVLFAVTGGVAFVRESALGAAVSDRLPAWTPRAVRAAAGALAVYIGCGALLVAGSLLVHHARVETLSHQVGGGWSGIPILLLGVLAAPNAAIAGASYLAGPGFAVGHGSGVSLGSSTHGTLPAFPVLAAVPSGPATTLVWLLCAAVPVLSGATVVRLARGAGPWFAQLRVAAAAVVIAALGAAVLAWQGGGSVGAGRLSALGASWWQFGLAVGAAVGAVSGGALSALGALTWLRSRSAGSASAASESAGLSVLVPVADAPEGAADDASDGNRQPEVVRWDEVS